MTAVQITKRTRACEVAFDGSRLTIRQNAPVRRSDPELSAVPSVTIPVEALADVSAAIGEIVQDHERTMRLLDEKG